MPDDHNMKVTTSIPKEIWKLAVFKDIRWCDALEIGIKYMAGDVMSDELKIVDRLERLKNEAEFLQNQLIKLKEESKLKKAEHDRRIVMSWDAEDPHGIKKKK